MSIEMFKVLPLVACNGKVEVTFVVCVHFTPFYIGSSYPLHID